jgi:16S rRNA (adenine1518-N6/adenine1519-N6)-dimethyltransferase
LNAAAVLKQYGLRADKGLGQNFLQDPIALEKIARAADIKTDDVVLEIGPGLGSLTRYLALLARQVVAVELDEKIMLPLRSILAPYQNIQLIHGDILEILPGEIIKQDGYIVAANIPYYITSAIVRHLLENHPKPRRIVLTMQKEVADRICARDGDMSLLSLSVQVYGKPTITERIPAGAFYPAPNVDSAVLCIDVYPEPLVPTDLLNVFFKMTKAGFSQKRKMMRNSLSAGLHISPADADGLMMNVGLDSKIRAEKLTIAQWKLLCVEWQKRGKA